MAISCILPSVAAKLKADLNDPAILSKLYGMSGKQRLDFFNGYIQDADMSARTASSFEKMMVSKQKNALQSWMKRTLSGTPVTAQRYRSVIDKINELDKLGVANPQTANDFLSNLVESSLGMSVSATEMRELTRRARNLDALYQKVDADGLPVMEYWKERQAMDKYVNGLTPIGKLRVATSTIRRGALLLSLKSPVTNIISNTVMGTTNSVARRMRFAVSDANKIERVGARGMNGDFARAYIKKVNAIYQASGYDISRMSRDWYGPMRLGEEITHAQGPGAIRKVGRFYEDVVFKQLMGAPDVLSSSIAFADSANLMSSYLARQAEKKGQLGGKSAQQYALDLFREATQIKAENEYSDAAKAVRNQAVADAMYSTYTNNGAYAATAMKVREALNDVTGGIRLGDQLMPFVKTPTNVVQAGIDFSALGLAKVALKLPDAIREWKAGNKVPTTDVIQDFVRAGLGTTLGVAIAYMIDPDDFVGAFDVVPGKGREMARLKNAPFNSVRVGNKWVSLDYFGPLAPTIIGVMYSRKYGGGPVGAAWNFGRGEAQQIVLAPGMREVAGIYEGLVKTTAQESTKGTKREMANQVMGYGYGAVVPAIFGDIAKATDTVQRKTDRNQASKIQANIPGLRQGLPARTALTTGKPVPSENPLSTMFFGSRISTATDEKAANEIDRLHKAGFGPSVTNIEYRNKRINELKAQIPNERFQKAIKTFQKIYGYKVRTGMQYSQYKAATDEERMRFINRCRDEALDETLNQFNYRKAKKKPAGTKIPSVGKAEKQRESRSGSESGGFGGSSGSGF